QPGEAAHRSPPASDVVPVGALAGVLTGTPPRTDAALAWKNDHPAHPAHTTAATTTLPTRRLTLSFVVRRWRRSPCRNAARRRPRRTRADSSRIASFRCMQHLPRVLAGGV